MAVTPNYIEPTVIDYYGNGTDTGHVLPNGAVPNLREHVRSTSRSR